MDSTRLIPQEYEAFIKEEKDLEFFFSRGETEESSIISCDDFKYKEEKLDKTSTDIDTSKCNMTNKEETEENKIRVEYMISDIPEGESEFCFVKSESSDRQNVLNDTAFKCNFCEKYFSEEKMLKKHIESHTKESTGIATDLSEMKIHNKKPFKCEKCGKCFSHSSALANHCRIDTGEKPFRCEQCGKSFSRSFTLTLHYRIHTGEKPFECEQCGKCFTYSYDLKRHNRIHTGEKPFKCEQCGKSFSRSYALNVHKRIHTGEKPFKCEQCGKCFSQSYTLTAHKRTHTGE